MSIESKVEENMGRKQDNDLLTEDELTAAFLNDEPQTPEKKQTENNSQDSNWNGADEDLPGQLAVDVYETEEKLVVKARTAGVKKEDLDVSISDGILTISGNLSSGDTDKITNWHIQECYWGDFSRTIALPVPVKEDEVEAILKDGVLTISFNKVKQEQAKRIKIL